MFACPTCSSQYSDIVSLSIHYRKTHKSTAQILYVALNCNGAEPSCKCGCGAAVKFLDITRGFRDFKAGHQSRVQNNFQTEKSRTNSIATRRKMIESGSFKPFHMKETGEHWGKGLTKETDERIRKMAEAVSRPEESARRSERLRRNRLNGVVRTLYKEEHSQWKGGIAPLSAYCRANIRLYSEWKYPLLCAAGFKCSLCKAERDLEVHHDKEEFSEILHHFAKVAGWDGLYYSSLPDNDPAAIAMKDLISSAVATHHISNNVSGVVLCQGCHKAEHKRLISVDIQPPLPP